MPVLTPLHMVSDRLSALLCAGLRTQPTWVVSSFRAGDVGPHEARATAGLPLHHLHPSALEGSAVRDVIRHCRQGTGQLVVFPDIPPEATQHLFNRTMRSVPARLFGRDARLHCGLADLARLIDTPLVYFSLQVVKHRLQLKVLGLVHASAVATTGASLIERGLREHPEQWLLWNSPSFFYFHPDHR